MDLPDSHTIYYNETFLDIAENFWQTLDFYDIAGYGRINLSLGMNHTTQISLLPILVY